MIIARRPWLTASSEEPTHRADASLEARHSLRVADVGARHLSDQALRGVRDRLRGQSHSGATIKEPCIESVGQTESYGGDAQTLQRHDSRMAERITASRVST